MWPLTSRVAVLRPILFASSSGQCITTIYAFRLKIILTNLEYNKNYNEIIILLFVHKRKTHFIKKNVNFRHILRYFNITTIDLRCFLEKK